MNLYEYQLRDKKTIQEQWEKFPAVLYQLPTGGGKTVVINSVIEDIIDKKVIILVHRIEIILQIRDRLRNRGIDCGVIAGNIEENIEANVLIGSILTVARDKRLDIILNKNYDYMIIDEAHHACSDSYLKVITKFKQHNENYKLLGVTATPYRKDKKSLSKIFDVMVKGPNYAWLRDKGYLAGYKCYPVKLQDLENVELSGGDYKISDLSKFMRSESLLNLAIDIYKKRGNNEQMLVFCVDIKHAIQVKQAYLKAGYDNIEIIDSNTSDEDRKKINQEYREGKVQIIVSIQTLTEGVDLPETKVVQLLRPTLSLVLYLQILGRGTRVKKDGSDLIILDCSNNTFTHGLLDSEYVWSLEETNPNPKIDDRKIVGKKKGGKRVLDEDEIGIEYDEVEEITHSEFLSIHSNGIEIAKNENAEKKKNILKKILELEDILNKKSKGKGIKFVFKTKDFINYDLFNTIYVERKEINETLLKFKIDKELNDFKFIFNTEYQSWNMGIEGIKAWEYLGIFQKFFNDNVQGIVKKYYKQIYDLNDSKIDIRHMEIELEEKKKEQDEISINECLKNGKYQFKLKERKWIGDVYRNVYGYVDNIVFTDKPNRLKSTNVVSFFDGTSLKGSVSSPKDKLHNILFENWEVVE